MNTIQTKYYIYTLKLNAYVSAEPKHTSAKHTKTN